MVLVRAAVAASATDYAVIEHGGSILVEYSQPYPKLTNYERVSGFGARLSKTPLRAVQGYLSYVA